MLDELVKTALVGTSRAQPSLTAVNGTIGNTFNAVKSGGMERQLLAAAAIASAYESCGWTPFEQTSVPEPAAPDSRAACSRRAGEILEQILAMTNTPTKQFLLDEWLGHADRAGTRPPHRLLPALLDHGASYAAVRPLIANVMDARGQWLVAQNPRWQFGVAERYNLESLWNTGTREQRVAAIRKLRAADPTKARELIASTWKEDGADERAAFVEAMNISLSIDDEPFLEAALDDRSKQVRTTAAELLARLPESGLVKRMIERVGALLAFTPAGKGGMIRKGKPATIAVTLLKEFDKAWLRDGVTEKPAERIGQKQWWLLEMLSMVPPAHWSRTWQCAAEDCVTAASSAEFGKVLLAAWNNAAERHPDPQWARALLLHAVNKGEDRGDVRVELLNALATEHQQQLLADVLGGSSQLEFETVGRIIATARFGFDSRSATAAVEQIDQHVKSNRAGGYDYQLPLVLEAFALRAPPEVHDDLAARWTGPGWEANHKALDQFLQTLHVRRDIQREFAK
jgi:hypothetical protein